MTARRATRRGQRVGAALAALGVVLTLGACAGGAEPVTVGLITKQEVNPYWVTMKESAQNEAGRENVDLLDADVLLIGYPFGDEGVLTRSALESDPLFQQIPAVAGGHYAVVDDAVASPLAYPTPLSQTWVLEQLLPVLQAAVAGTPAPSAAPTSGS